jgi:hypothetical protein
MSVVNELLTLSVLALQKDGGSCKLKPLKCPCRKAGSPCNSK